MKDARTTLSLQSVSLHVADVERSVAFYSKLPGAQTVIHHPGAFAKIKFGAAYIQVVSIPASETKFHIELNAEDLSALHDALKAAGIEPDGPPTKQFFGRTQFEVHDPDGYILEFDTP
jgi:catechol 2,3-dioxygenase-like lactoylglutathione lyase family enzyme